MDLLTSSFKATHPSQEVYSVTKTIVVDSRQRNCSKYRTPSYYKLELGDVFKNITSIELKGAIIPKTSYNVHSSNNKIDFAIGDSVTSFNIITGGAGYTVAPNVTLSSPPGAGVTATATSVIDAAGRVTNIVIGVAGSGYSPSQPPFVYIEAPNVNSGGRIQAKATSIIGTHYTATLRPGEYCIGGNNITPSTTPTGLLLEIQNAMNYVVNGGAYDPVSTSPFAVRVISQYPTLGATVGTPEASDTNACLFNRIQVINVNSSVWEFLWCSGPSKLESSSGILGFNLNDTGIGVSFSAVMDGLDVLIPGGTAIRGTFDYNLKNDPDFVILSIAAGDRNLDRITSLDDGMDHKFAVLVFDSNNPETLRDLSGGTITTVASVKYLEGPTTKGTFWQEPGAVKPLKGYDYESKKITFSPPQGKISSLTISFTKFGLKAGGVPQFYDFNGRDHTLIFEVSATDQYSHQKD